VIPSIIKTINLFTAAPSLNLYDATATDLLDLFSDTPDFTPYNAVPTDPTIFDPSKVKRGNFTAADLQGGEEIDNAEVIAARQRAEQTPQAARVNPAGARRGFLHDDPYDSDDR